MTSENDENKLLHQAALFDNVELMESLLIGPARNHIDEQDLYGRTPLYTSITNDSLKCCHLLLMAGANPDIACSRECTGMTPLHAAARGNKERFLELLLEYGANINLLDNFGYSAMDIAIKHNNVDCVDSMQMHIDLQSIKNVEIETTFLEACKMGNVQMARSVIASSNFTPKMIHTLVNSSEHEHDLLYSVCRSGYAETCEYLLSLGAEVRVETLSGLSPVHIACLAGHLDCVDVLLKAFPYQVAVPTLEGLYPLHLASMQGRLEVVELLVTILLCHSGCLDTDSSYSNETFESALNFRDNKGCTCLHLAVECGSVELVRFFLDLRKTDGAGDLDPGASDRSLKTLMNVDALDGEGRTALHLAIMKHNPETGRTCLQILKLLLDYGANPNTKFEIFLNNKKEKCISTPLAETVKTKDEEMVRLLMKYGADDDNISAAKLAIRNQAENLIQVFLENQVCLDAENTVCLEDAKCHVSPPVNKMFNNSRSAITCNSFPGLKFDWSSLGLTALHQDWLHKAGERLCFEKMSMPNIISARLITDLDLSHNLIVDLPFCVWQLSNLRKLNLSNNELKFIEVAKPQSNRKLLGKSEIYNFDSALIHLDHFDSTDTPELTSLAESQDFTESSIHDHLEEINLKCNKLKEVPSAIFGIPTLKRLNLSFNRMTSLPISMWTCTSLVKLDASHNLLPELPSFSDPSSSACKDCNFRERISARCSSSDDSAVLFDGEMPESDILVDDSGPCHSHISYWQDKIKVQPPFFDDEDDTDVFKMTSHLKELDLSFNLLEEVPAGLPCLAYRLEKLFLSNNQITRFGLVQSYPATLEVLDLSRNQISEDQQVRRISSTLPSLTPAGMPKICRSPLCVTSSYSPSNSPLLTSCRLMSRCSVTSLSNLVAPQSLNAPCSHSRHFQLNKLKTLLLTFNCLKTFTFCCKDEQNLKSLTASASGDVLRSPTVLFPNLITLDLSNNLIAAFPKDIGHLRNLSTLTMANNRIVDLPHEVGFLKKLWSLNFSGNPVDEILRSRLGDRMKAVKSVVSYLRSIMDEVVPFNHLKLMVVGRQGTGKTSLLQTLVGDVGKNSHWMSRRDRTMKGKDSKGENLSTVGIDIGDMVLRRDNDEVVFSTWDFGGQREYYATHQYFLTKRSVYLVVWKITDGEEGINEIFRWLINIQARAPNSCVVIVGTHLDLAFKNFPVKFLEEMTTLLEKRYIKLAEPGRWGFPKIIGHIMVSCKPGMMSKSNYQRLHQAIWKAVDLTLDNTGNRLLDQKVPVSYIRLQKAIKVICESRKDSNNDPVLNSDQYKQLVIETMEDNFGVSFQDLTELNQATQFLHENGFLLHYEDTNLKNIYFLDPQWLCDMMACIVTIKQINGLTINGVMRLDDLPILLKGVSFRSKDIKKYVINLLHKFEVALQWDDVHLLIPSLLPTDGVGVLEFVMIPVMGEENILTSPDGNSIPAVPRTVDINNPFILRCANPAFSFFRLYTMSYFPSGFWPRLITRMLGDVSYLKLLESLYDLSILSSHNVDVDNLPGSYWHCWQTGLELRHLGLPILRVKEVSSSTSPGVFSYSKCHPVMKEESDCTWYSVFMPDNSILEIVVYNESFTLKPSNEDTVLTFYPVSEIAVRILTIVVEQIDTLLEDWYPTVGTRFTKDIKGAMLINRLVPCTKCLMGQNERQEKQSDKEGKVSSTETCCNGSDESQGVGFVRDCDSPTGVVYCFSIEHCIHVAQSDKVVSCPRHGNLGPYCTADEKGLVHFVHVAPDAVFYDLPSDLIIHPDNLQRTKFLGKGAFGAVYDGLVHLKKSNCTCPVAVKLLRPIIPEEEMPLDLFRLFQKECELWTRDPVLKCCEAYMIARKELSILLNLNHENVVSLVGICVSPPCLVLSLAPLGCLNDHLKSFRKGGLKLPLYAIRDVIVQVSSALNYLHSKCIIYRDLKSENILVWSFPDWQSRKSLNPVFIKLADYGVSRVFSPSGIKGYAGTLPFMAPEILVQNGEETYTEKVDCYSFSLLIYELISLKMPYEGDMLLSTCGINLKSHVLAGGRPVLSLKEARHPTNILDLMTTCWSSDPHERLSAINIELFARQPELCSLLDAVTFDEDVLVACAAFVPRQKLAVISTISLEEVPREILMYGFVSENNRSKRGSLYVYSFSEEGLGHIRKLNSGVERVVSICSAGDFVWCATERSEVHIFRLPEYSEVMKIAIAVPPTGITCLCEVQNSLCISLDDGTFLLCSLNVDKDKSDMDVSIEKYAGNGGLVHCILYSCISNRHFLWCGQTQGSLVLWELIGSSLRPVQSFAHTPPFGALSDTVHITSGGSDSAHFFTYVYPGSTVYRWDARRWFIDGTIDLSNISPPLSVDAKIFYQDQSSQANHCKVTCMTMVGGTLYVATTFGCLLSVDPDLMTCNFICRIDPSGPPSFCAILPLSSHSDYSTEFYNGLSPGGKAETQEGRDKRNGGSAQLKADKCLFATIMPGYRSLKDATLSCSALPTKDGTDSTTERNFHVLMWSDEVFRQSRSV